MYSIESRNHDRVFSFTKFKILQLIENMNDSRTLKEAFRNFREYECLVKQQEEEIMKFPGLCATYKMTFLGFELNKPKTSH